MESPFSGGSCPNNYMLTSSFIDLPRDQVIQRNSYSKSHAPVPNH